MTSKDRTIGAVLTTSSVDIYTVPLDNKAEVQSIVVANATGAGVAVTMQWYSAANTTNYTLMGTVIIDANSLVQIENIFHLGAGDKLKALAATGSAITVSVKVAEIYFPKQF